MSTEPAPTTDPIAVIRSRLAAKDTPAAELPHLASALETLERAATVAALVPLGTAYVETMREAQTIELEMLRRRRERRQRGEDDMEDLERRLRTLESQIPPDVGDRLENLERASKHVEVAEPVRGPARGGEPETIALKSAPATGPVMMDGSGHIIPRKPPK